jgi:predicted ATP-binding protein involved in virulence
MINLKRIKLVNFCGYRDLEIDLTNKDGSIKKWLMLYGPNGSFKSTFLEAVYLLSSARSFQSRDDLTLFFRRLTYHPNYHPGLEGYDKSKTEMTLTGIFDCDGEEKKVVIHNNWIPEESGVIVNELTDYDYSVSFNASADNPLNMQRFQIPSALHDEFLEFASDVYSFACDIPDTSLDESSGKDNIYFTDLVMQKGDTKVHYRSFSDGEKKIATLIRQLFIEIYVARDRSINENNILLIDNIAMHIYWKRHMRMIENLNKFFPDHQIIATTHSPVIIGEAKEINGMDKKYLINMEKCGERNATTCTN